MTYCLLLSFFNLPDAIYYVRAWRRVAIAGARLSFSVTRAAKLSAPPLPVPHIFNLSGTQFCKTAIEILHNGCVPFKGTGSMGSWIPRVRLANFTIRATFVTCWLWHQIYGPITPPATGYQDLFPWQIGRNLKLITDLHPEPRRNRSTLSAQQLVYERKT
jgi:hypothetical protein